jgi:hypothetical protein
MPGGWRFHVRVRQPGVKRKHRHLDGKAERERDEQKDLKRAHGQHRAERLHIKNIERAGAVSGRVLQRVRDHLRGGVVPGE